MNIAITSLQDCVFTSAQPVSPHSIKPKTAKPPFVEVAIIGAGPYGLSLAAHLREADVSFRIFGKPMHAWRNYMPQGMFLKSDASSSDLQDPDNQLTLKQFHAEQGHDFSPKQVTSRSTFISYGLEFQSRFVPDIEPQDVIAVDQDDSGYTLRLSNREIVKARQVVVAIGIYPFRYTPPPLAELPPEFCTHSAEHSDLTKFRGKRVAVIGSGASAVDIAICLADQDAEPVLISRRGIRFQDPPSGKKPSLLSRIMKPDSGIGMGWRLKICADAPYLVHMMPTALRAAIVRRALGPMPGWFTKDRVVGRIPIYADRSAQAAEVVNNTVKLTLAKADGETQILEFDHVIAATGYRTNLERLSFLAENIRMKTRTYEGSPLLSRHFESSCKGLYFIGPTAALSFGPVLRFVYGAKFAVKTVAKRLAHRTQKADKQPNSLIAEVADAAIIQMPESSPSMA